METSQITDLAAEQWGLVTAAQARRLGATPQALARLANQGVLERVAHGIYRVSGSPQSRFDALRAAWLGLDAEFTARERLLGEAPAVVSFRSAALVHGLGDLDADDMEFTLIERKQSRREGVRIHRAKVTRDDWTIVEGLPVTTVIRTIEDLASIRIDGGHLASVVRDALTQQKVDDGALAAVLGKYAHFYGARPGDGESLMTRFVSEAGVPESLGRTVTRSYPGFDPAIAAALANSAEFKRIQEQMEAIQKAFAPSIKASQLLADSPMMKAAAAAAKSAAIFDNSSMKAITEMARMAQAPYFERLAAMQPAIGRFAELASRAGDEDHVTDEEVTEE